VKYSKKRIIINKIHAGDQKMNHKFLLALLTALCMTSFSVIPSYANKPTGNPGKSPNTRECPICASSPVDSKPCNSCISYQIPFGAVSGNIGLSGGSLSIYSVNPSPTIATPGKLVYNHPLLTRYLRTQTSSLLSGVNLAVYLMRGRDQVSYAFRAGETIGYPDGVEAVESTDRLERLDASRNPTTGTNPAYYRLYDSTNGYLLINAATGQTESYTSATGRTITKDSPEVRLDVMYDDAGSLRQIYSGIDGLADIVMSGMRNYKINIYAPSNVGGKTNGLYTFTGEPYLVYDVKSANIIGSVITIKRTVGENVYESNFTYSDSQGDWTLNDGSNLSEPVTTKREKFWLNTAKTQYRSQVVVKDTNGVVISETNEDMEVKSYGDFPVREYQGPVSYGLVTEKTYDFTANSGKLGNYARLTSVKYPSGNWERFTYETVGGKATGRIAKKVSAWKNNPFSSADT